MQPRVPIFFESSFAFDRLDANASWKDFSCGHWQHRGFENLAAENFSAVESNVEAGVEGRRTRLAVAARAETVLQGPLVKRNPQELVEAQ